jgi:hypothetical protein
MEPLNRRHFLHASLAGASWLTPVGHWLARAAETAPDRKAPAKSVIMLWMAGGPSQLETFDPHPGTKIGGDTKAIRTAAKGIEIASGLPLLAEEMGSVALVRSLVSKEGDHERGTYTLKTGFRPDPTVIHPALGAIACHSLPQAGTDIPRHVSIFPGQWPARGGYLGDRLDAFHIDDPAGPVPDTSSFLPQQRDADRARHLNVVEAAFAKGREKRIGTTLHTETIAAAQRMMASEQLQAFDVSREPLSVRQRYGNTPFGRGCLAARRLIEVGVRCVEVTLGSWDSHINNHEFCGQLNATLDPAFAALLRDLRERQLLASTLVMWGGEFGRTPHINGAGGRDHWPTGFSVALAGGGIRGGQALGATDPQGESKEPTTPVNVGDLHATALHCLGIDFTQINQTPIGRTVKFAEGKVLEPLVG